MRVAFARYIIIRYVRAVDYFLISQEMQLFQDAENRIAFLARECPYAFAILEMFKKSGASFRLGP